MNAIHQLKSRIVPCLLLVFLVLAAHAAAPKPAATYQHHALALEIPYQLGRSGAGRLTIDLLSPEDEVLGHSERPVDATKGEGLWRQELTPNAPIPYEELVWERIRYRFRYNGETAPAIEQVQTLGDILRRPVLQVLGQTAYLAGAQAAIRVVVLDGNSDDAHPITQNGSVHIELIEANEKPRTLFNGRLDHHGTVDVALHFPAGLTGSYALHFVAETPIGTVETTQAIRLEDKVGILLTTEKPIYQPAQTIHVRALALDRANHRAAADRKLTLELEDSRGNKVFRRAVQTDAYGIASAEFALADEVNLGAYHLRALMGDPANPSETQQLTLQVERYVLPKFRVAIELPQKNGKPRRDYRPGDHITGTIRANYFFGKPVENAPVQITVHGMDVSLFTAAHAQGSTNAAGDYRFDITLPSYMAGRKSQGAAPVLVEATVKDSAGHAETKGEGVTVSQSPLLLTALPEGGTLVPGMENQVFVLASYPDGTPAQSELALRFGAQPTQHIATDKGGIAILRVTPTANGDRSLHIEADDRHGSRATNTVDLQTRYGDDQILLRLPHAVYKPGDNLNLTVFSTRQHGTAYIDLVKDGQTILTRDVEIANGRAELSVRATPQMAGTLSVTAYVLGRDAQTVEDHRMLFVQPADELHIQATADAASYVPGSEARVHFHVTNARGEGVQAALGLEVVDEAVFALAEKQPGFAKIFFYLEQELLKPRYEIHSLSMNEAVNTGDATQSDQHDRAAQVLFSAAETVNVHTLRAEAGQQVPMERAAEYQQRYLAAFEDHVRNFLVRLPPPSTNDADFSQRFARLIAQDGERPHDAWGTPLRVDPPSPAGGRRKFTPSYYRIRSAGPDRQFDTADDLTVMVESRLGELYPKPRTGTMELQLEHDRGPVTGLSEIAGIVTDPTGASISGASVRLRRLDAAGTRNGAADRDGAFTLSALPVGHYRLEITSPAFMTSVREFTLGPRDRAVIHCTLQVGMAMDTVTVEAAAPMLMTENAQIVALPMMGRAMGAAAPKMAYLASGAAIGGGLALEQRTLKSEQATEGHIRSYFPEALYIQPEILTDGRGNASIVIPVADSITTWRMAMFASTQGGALGSGTSSLKVFQDFFVDLDLPVTLTQGDRVSIPVAVYNYSGSRGDVSLSLEQQDWFDLVDDHAEKTIPVDAGKVGGTQFTVQVKRLGKFKLTLAAHMQGRQDTVVREIEVVPNGQQQEIVFNGRLEASSNAQHFVRFPQDALPDASKLFVRLYPGALSQVIEGMDGILQMPGGCFEQTSSSTYPNVLALDYMKRTKKLTPEVHAKAEGYIANGYQRLLTFEVPGGGFSWFGRAPANKILTAYGLMEFRDMSRVYDVDPKLIERTAHWLAAQQQPDGSWKPDTQFINEGATNRYNSDVLRITAYLAWALENSGSEREAVQRAKGYIAQHLDGGKADAYTLAVLANFAVEADKSSELSHRVLEMLIDARTEKGDRAWWTSAETGVYGSGESAAVETTGLAIQALLKSGQHPEVVRRALAWLLEKKGASGNWGTTQATIMALRALLAASEASGSDARGTVEVLVNGKAVESVTLTAENNDLLHQFTLPQPSASEDNKVELRFHGSGSMAYQIAGRYFTPWPAKAAKEALSIDVAYDRTRLAQNDIVAATATVHNNLDKTANMVMVDLGIPPGFELQTEDLQAIVEKTAQARTGRLEKFSLTATQAILYLNSIGAGETLHLRFRLRAKYPIRAKNFASRVYEYYDPAVSDTAKPVQFEVTGK